jgi:hypothetical protein
MNLEELKYPIGKLKYLKVIEKSHIKEWINTIKDFPYYIKNELSGLNSKELNYKYRPNGWTIQQVVCHCIDSHLNSFIRFKLALTEDIPIIRLYVEDKWAELPDTTDYDIYEAIIFLTALHKRWVFLLESLNEEQLNKTFIHPDGNEIISLKENLCIYAWHCKHHLQHIINAKKFKY